MMASCWKEQFPKSLVSFGYPTISLTQVRDFCPNFGRGCCLDGTTAYNVQVGQDSGRNVSQSGSLALCSWRYVLELKSSLLTAWPAIHPVCDTLPTESIVCASEGLAFIGSTCCLVWFRAQVKKGGHYGGPEHLSTWNSKTPGEYELRLGTVTRTTWSLWKCTKKQ